MNISAIDAVTLKICTAKAQIHCLSMLLKASDHEAFPSNQILSDTLYGIANTLEDAYVTLEEV